MKIAIAQLNYTVGDIDGNTAKIVGAIDEARRLREAGITAPVFCWLHTVDDGFGPAMAEDVELSASSLAGL